MYNVISEFRLGKYYIMTLNKSIKEKSYSVCKVAGQEFPLVTMYDFNPLCIAIETNRSFLGKDVELV